MQADSRRSSRSAGPAPRRTARRAVRHRILSGPDFAKLSKEYSDLRPIVEDIEALWQVRREAASLAAMAQSGDDPEMEASPRTSCNHCASACPRSRNGSSCRCCRRMPTTSATRSSKSAPAPAARRRRCSPPSCSACTSAMRRCAAGASRSSTCPRPGSAAARRRARSISGRGCLRAAQIRIGSAPRAARA